MSTPSFGQPSPFGSATPPPPPVTEEPTGAKGSKTVVIAVAAGVVALGVLGGAAALVLGSEPAGTVDGALPPAAVGTVEPSTAPSTPDAPLPTAVVQGRNVFIPLVEDDAAGAAAEVVDPVAAAAPSPTPTVAPTAAPVPLPLPVPAVTRTVAVPGPVVTQSVPGPIVTEPVPGPTVTTGPTEQVDRFAYRVEVIAVEPLLDEAGEPVMNADGEPDSTATFRVNDKEYVVNEGDQFLQVFEYVDARPAPTSDPGTAAPTDPADELSMVTFYWASSIWEVPVGTDIGLGPR